MFYTVKGKISKKRKAKAGDILSYNLEENAFSIIAAKGEKMHFDLQRNKIYIEFAVDTERLASFIAMMFASAANLQAERTSRNDGKQIDFLLKRL